MISLSSFVKLLVGACAGIVLLSGIICIYFFPVFNNLPQPTGPYAVGCCMYHLADANQPDTRYKEFNVAVFYPCAASKNVSTTYPYQPAKLAGLASLMAQKYHLPRWLFELMFAGITTFTQPNANVLATLPPAPVIIFLPGICSDNLYNVYLEELASHGFIICAIEPPYDSLLTIFPDDTLIGLDPELQQAIDTMNRDQIYAYRDRAHERWSHYVHLALAFLKKAQHEEHSPLKGKLDFARIGLLGHSHGGAVVTDLCQKDTFWHAGVNMDGWTKTYNSGAHFSTPFLFLLSQSGRMPEMDALFTNNQRSDFIVKTLATSHDAFGDRILVKQPLARWLHMVPGNNTTIQQQIKHELVTFFETNLGKFTSQPKKGTTNVS